MKRRLRWIAIATMCMGALTTRAAEVTVIVRDAITGAPVSATLRVDDARGRGLGPFTLDQGRARVAITAGEGRFVVESPDHRPLRANVRVDDSSLPLTFLLDPVAPPPEQRAARELAARSPGMAVVHGWVRDAADAGAVMGARVSLDDDRAETITDNEGHFQLIAPAATASDGQAPPRARLRVTTEQGARLERESVIVPGAQTVLLMLGAPVTPDHAQIDPDRALRERAPEAIARPDTRPTEVARATAMTPPAVVRVGFGDAACTTSCCTASCTNTCVLSLETYVARGLNDEWIASWGTHSLRAGSIAYRSYGAYHVLHPRTANFDICSSACCQVNDPDTHANTDAAVARTPGIVLTRDDVEPFRAEYSAENNAWDDPNDGLACSNADLSCGDGVVGSPSAQWPCLADSVAAGHGCFGHGRGMSQWGTQRWSLQNRPWRWIADHYFNDNGNVGGAGTGLRTATLTSPLDITAAAATPSTVAPGASLDLAVTASNAASAAHTHLLIGASLYRAGVGYLSDSAHDAPASLAAAASGIVLHRAFDVPLTAQGVFALDVALYLDVDENGLITTDDLRLSYRRVDNAVTVASAGDAVFTDDFE